MHRQRVPPLDTNSPVGWFARFIAIASTLGCGLAFSADKIPDMATNAVYDKIEAETPVAASSTMVDTQRARKKRAAKAKEANATLAGHLRVACMDDPSASQTLYEAIGPAGQDGVLGLQALWTEYGPVARLMFTQQSFEQYVHKVSESIGIFIVTMDTFFEWFDLGGMKLTARRKCEMALKKVHAMYRLTMLATCSAYGYKWTTVKKEFKQLHTLNLLLGDSQDSNTTSNDSTHAHAASSGSSPNCKHCGKKHPSDSCIQEPGISQAEKSRRWDAWKAYRQKLGIWFDKVRTPQARLASLEAHAAQHGAIDAPAPNDTGSDVTGSPEPFAASAKLTEQSASHPATRIDTDVHAHQPHSFANQFDRESVDGESEAGCDEASDRFAHPTAGAYAATLIDRPSQQTQAKCKPALLKLKPALNEDAASDDENLPDLRPISGSESESDLEDDALGHASNWSQHHVYAHSPARRRHRSAHSSKAARNVTRPREDHSAWSCAVRSVMVLAAIVALGLLLVGATDAVLPATVQAAPARHFVHAAWNATPIARTLPDYVPSSAVGDMHAHAAKTRSRAKKRARAHVGSTLDLCPDSGASHHFFPDVLYFKSMRRVTGRTVNTANGTAKICGVGEVDLWLTGSDGRPVVVTVEAFYAPEFVKPLLSVSQLVAAGHSVHFRPQGCGMNVRRNGTNEGRWVPIACRGGNYTFNVPAALAVTTRQARARQARDHNSGGTSTGAEERTDANAEERTDANLQRDTSTDAEESAGANLQRSSVQRESQRPALRRGNSSAGARAVRAEERTDANAVAWWHACLGHINSTDCNAAVQRGRIKGVPSRLG